MDPQKATIVTEFLISNMKAEIPITAGVFAAVPVDGLHYSPDPTSKTALGLLRHITLEDEWFLKSICDGRFEPPPDDSDACGLMTPADAVARYQQRIPALLEQVGGLSGEQLARDIDLMGVFKMPAVGFLSLTLRHSTHHRGQLSAYLRAMGGKVPGIYGPSADTAMQMA